MKRQVFVTVLCLVFFSVTSFAADMLSLVPYNAALIVNVNLEKISALPGVKAFMDSALAESNNNKYTKDFEKLGINPYTDVKNIILFMTEDEKVAFLAEGTFDTIVTCETVQNDAELQKVYTYSAIGGLPALYNESAANSTVVFIDQRTLAFGDTEVLEIIGNLFNEKDEAKSIKKNPNFVYMTNRLDLNKQFWGAGFSGSNIWKSNVKTAPTDLDNVRMAIFDIDYGETDFEFAVSALVARNNELEALTKSFNELSNTFKGYVATVPGMTRIFENAKVTNDGSNMATYQIKMPVKDFNEALLSASDFVDNNK